LISLVVFVPAVSIFLMKYLHLPAHHADLWMARGSIIITTVSMLIMGIAVHHFLLIFGLLIYNMGTGYSAAMRSTAIHVVGGQSSPDIGRLMSVIAIVESIGIMIAGPMLNKALEVGIEMGEPWVGLPYLGCGVVFGVITVITFLISVKDKGAVYFEVAADEELDGEEPLASSSAVEGRVSLTYGARESVDGFGGARQKLV